MLRAVLEDGSVVPVVRLERSEEPPVMLHRAEPEGMTKEDWLITGVAGGTMAIMLVTGGKVVMTAMMLSLLTVGGAIILWIKAPTYIRDIPGVSHAVKLLPGEERRERLLNTNWKQKMEKHEFAMDAAVSIGALSLFGMTVTGMIAAGMSGLGMSVLFRVKRAVVGRPKERMA